jgi:four helix bundle protein
MSSVKKGKKFDLEDRTFQFARRVRVLGKAVPTTASNREDVRQLVRASGSVGANCIEANNALGKKDFLLRIKICRKEAKESGYWLRLVDIGSAIRLDAERQRLIEESMELVKIFGTILRNSR